MLKKMFVQLVILYYRVICENEGDTYSLDVLLVGILQSIVTNHRSKETKEATNVVGIAEPILHISLDHQVQLHTDEGLGQACQL